MRGSFPRRSLVILIAHDLAEDMDDLPSQCEGAESQDKNCARGGVDGAELLNELFHVNVPR